MSHRFARAGARALCALFACVVGLIGHQGRADVAGLGAPLSACRRPAADRDCRAARSRAASSPLSSSASPPPLQLVRRDAAQLRAGGNLAHHGADPAAGQLLSRRITAGMETRERRSILTRCRRQAADERARHRRRPWPRRAARVRHAQSATARPRSSPPTAIRAAVAQYRRRGRQVYYGDADQSRVPDELRPADDATAVIVTIHAPVGDRRDRAASCAAAAGRRSSSRALAMPTTPAISTPSASPTRCPRRSRRACSSPEAALVGLRPAGRAGDRLLFTRCGTSFAMSCKRGGRRGRTCTETRSDPPRNTAHILAVVQWLCWHGGGVPKR